jgi:hypothetical protein
VQFWVVTAAIGWCFMAPSAGCAQALTSGEALERYLARGNSDRPLCSDSTYAVDTDAQVPALKKPGSMTGFKRVAQTGHVVYRGLRFTGDNIVKTRVILKYLAHETEPAANPENTAITAVNYKFLFSKVSDYNGVPAYVFPLRPRNKRAGLIRGELWLTADSAVPLRIWGDLVKSPSIFIRSFRLVQDYEMADECGDPLRLLLTVRTRIVGTVEMTLWLHRAPGLG